MLPSVMMYTFVSDAVYQYYNDVWLQSNNTAVCPINITDDHTMTEILLNVYLKHK